MRNTLEGSRYVYVSPNGDSKMITFTHNRGNDECATQNGGWDNSYISQGFYDESVKPKLNDGFSKDSKTATFAKIEQKTDSKGGKCSTKTILLAVGLIAFLLAAVGAAFFIFGTGESKL